MGNNGPIKKFLSGLEKNSPKPGAEWVKTDCHFHTSASFDSTANIKDMVEALSSPSNAYRLAVVTDHNYISEYDKARDIAQEKGLILLPGAEIYAKLPAIQAETGKTTESYFHLLIIFDPDVPALISRFENLITNNKPQTLPHGTRQNHIVDLLSWHTFEEFAKRIHDSSALLIPAHLHTNPAHPEKSRSIDDIFADKLFLNWIDSCKFDALEVIDPKTAAFFDGKHSETHNIRISCIRSSDAHTPEEIGRRATWMKMENPSYDGLRLALQDRDTRISLTDPTQRNHHKIIGARIQGRFFKDQWVRFNDDLNCLIGAKGKGKSALLESIRFALRLPIPEIEGSSREKQKFKNRNEALLDNILGSRGTVECLVESQAGIKYLFNRARHDSAPTITSDTDEIEKPYYDLSGLFDCQFYGWEELTSCSEEMNILTDVFDTHFEPIQTSDGKLSHNDITRLLEGNSRDLDKAAGKVQGKMEDLLEFQRIEATINSLTAKLSSESKGQENLQQCIACQELYTKEESLLESIDDYVSLEPSIMLVDTEDASEPVALEQPRKLLVSTKGSSEPEKSGQTETKELDIEKAKTDSVFVFPVAVSQKRDSVLEHFSALIDLYTSLEKTVKSEWAEKHPDIISSIKNSITEYRDALRKTADALRKTAGIEDDSEAQVKLEAIKKLQRSIAENQKAIRGKNKETLEQNYTGAVKEYVSLCCRRHELFQYLADGRSAIACKLTEEYDSVLKAEFAPRCQFGDYRRKLKTFFTNSGLQYTEVVDTIIGKLIMPEDFCMLLADWEEKEVMKALDISKEQAAKLNKHTYTDLVSKLKHFHDVCVADQPQVKMVIDESALADEDKYRLVSKLSAGERSTVILPLVTHGTANPLAIDQPEDDLDNAYIHDNFVHSLLRKTKGSRQFIFASHNANIPVLGDAENIIILNASRDHGWIEKNGCTDSLSQQIMDILEGGEKAFTDRLNKHRFSR